MNILPFLKWKHKGIPPDGKMVVAWGLLLVFVHVHLCVELTSKIVFHFANVICLIELLHCHQISILKVTVFKVQHFMMMVLLIAGLVLVVMLE